MSKTAGIVYGFCEGEDDIQIDPEWLAAEYDRIGTWALYVESDGCMGEACYGVLCEMDSETGVIRVDDTSKDMVKKLFDQVSNYIVDGFIGKLGYYSVICGDHYSYHLKYIPVDMDDSESDSVWDESESESVWDESESESENDSDSDSIPPLELPKTISEETPLSTEDLDGDNVVHRNSEKSIKSSEWEEI
jgi:hypothetical protein